MLDISDWVRLDYYSTKGTRNKSVVISPDGVNYYFKTSLYKLGKDYKYEFWSEIIASEIGSMIGLDVLRYSPAIQGSLIGCLSEFLNKPEPEMEMLNEGVQYLQGFDPSFAPEETKGGNAYTFQLIMNSLDRFELDHFRKDIIDMIIFDAIIGNGDRHQENWAFISTHGRVSKQYVEFVRLIKQALTDQELWKILPKWLKLLIKWFYTKGTTQQLRDEVIYARLKWNSGIRFSSIYDNGSSLGRELTNEMVSNMLRDDTIFQRYVENGKSEIHWDGVKLKHFELIGMIIELFPEVRARGSELCKKFSQEKLDSFIKNVDEDVPREFLDFSIPVNRKEFIGKNVSLRIQRLEKLFNG